MCCGCVLFHRGFSFLVSLSTHTRVVRWYTQTKRKTSDNYRFRLVGVHLLCKSGSHLNGTTCWFVVRNMMLTHLIIFFFCISSGSTFVIFASCLLFEINPQQFRLSLIAGQMLSKKRFHSLPAFEHKYLVEIRELWLISGEEIPTHSEGITHTHLLRPQLTDRLINLHTIPDGTLVLFFRVQRWLFGIIGRLSKRCSEVYERVAPRLFFFFCACGRCFWGIVLGDTTGIKNNL